MNSLISSKDISGKMMTIHYIMNSEQSDTTKISLLRAQEATGHSFVGQLIKELETKTV